MFDLAVLEGFFVPWSLFYVVLLFLFGGNIFRGIFDALLRREVENATLLAEPWVDSRKRTCHQVYKTISTSCFEEQCWCTTFGPEFFHFSLSQGFFHRQMALFFTLF